MLPNLVGQCILFEGEDYFYFDANKKVSKKSVSRKGRVDTEREVGDESGVSG